MKLNDKILKISRWDSYSAVIFILAVLFQSMKWWFLPIFLDIYYHLLTAAGFNEAGGWVYHCFWEYAPIGRPQLYPPLLHIILLLFMKLGIPTMIIGKLIQWSMYPLVLFTIWYVVRALFDKRQAFFTLIMLFSTYSFYLTTVIASAASLSFILCFFSVLLFERNKIIPSSLLLALGLYAHGYTSWIFVGYFLVYALLIRKRLMSCVKVVGAALGLASPFLVFQLKHISFFHFQRDIVENYSVELSMFLWILFLFGFVFCFQERKRYYILIALFCSSALLLLSGAFSRYTSFYGILSVVLVNAAFLNHGYSQLNARQIKLFGVLFFVLCAILSPTLAMQYPFSRSIGKYKNTFLYKPPRLASQSEAGGQENRIKVIAERFSWYKNYVQGTARFCLNTECSVSIDFLDSSFVNFISYGRQNKVRANDITIYNKKHFTQLTDVIRSHSDADDILYSNAEFPYLAGVLALLSHRVMSTAMLSEVAPYHAFDAVSVSRLIIWQKDPRDMRQEPVVLMQKYRLRKIADTALAFVYENPSCTVKKKIIPATIGYKALFLMLFLAGTAIASAKFGIDK